MPPRITQSQRILLVIFTLMAGPMTAWVLADSAASGLYGAPLSIIGIAAYLYLSRELGASKSLFFGVVMGAYSFGAELLGTRTGFPYGHFTYTNALGVQLLGIPLTIALVWPIILLGLLTLTKNRALLPLIGGCGAVLFDIILEPTAVRLGYWQWLELGIYHGAPWSNFFGWFLFGSIGTILAALLLGDDITRRHRRWAYASIYTMGIIAWMGLWLGFIWQAVLAATIIATIPYIWERNGMYKKAYIRVIK